MSAVDDTIIGANSTITIGSKSYNTKRALRAHFGQEPIKDATEAGLLKHPGLSDNYFDATIYVKQEDVVPLLGLTVPDSNRKLTELTVSITYKAFDGGTSTISGTASVYSADVDDTDPEAKVTAAIHVEYIGPVTRS